MRWNCVGSLRVPASLFGFAAYCTPFTLRLDSWGRARAVKLRILLDDVDAQARLADAPARTTELRHTRAYRLLLRDRTTVRNHAAGIAGRPSPHAAPSSLRNSRERASRPTAFSEREQRGQRLASAHTEMTRFLMEVIQRRIAFALSGTVFAGCTGGEASGRSNSESLCGLN